MFIKGITHTAGTALYIDFNIEIDSDGRVIRRTATRNEMVSILNSPFMCSNIPKVMTYGVYIPVYIPRLSFHCNNKYLFINYCYIYITKMKTVFVQLCQYGTKSANTCFFSRIDGL